MRKSAPAADPDTYVRALIGWRRECVDGLRAVVRKTKALDETIKWGQLVYFSNGPVLLIRAEDERVLFGFWRGQRLSGIEPRLKGDGKYEMATLELREGDAVKPTVAARLAKEAVKLASRSNLDEGLRHEVDLFALCFSSEDKDEGVKAFLEKRKADFKGK